MKKKNNTIINENNYIYTDNNKIEGEVEDIFINAAESI